LSKIFRPKFRALSRPASLHQGALINCETALPQVNSKVKFTQLLITKTKKC